MKHKLSLLRAMFSILLILLGGQSFATAQTETFDSGASIFTPGANAWLKSEFFPQSYTFPTVGTGKGLRILANPIPNQAPGVAAIYRTNIYTDFYMAVDFVAWSNTNQAVFMFARGTNLVPINGAKEYLVNYDVLQSGQNPGDRLGAQLQLSVVSPGFVTTQIGIAEFTLVQGNTYRIVFKGVDNAGLTDLTVQAYDHNDLTKPLVTLFNHDSTYASGVSGIGNFSRHSVSGAPTAASVSDSTFDNYYAAATDPNTDIAPAIRHPIAGTPQVVTRTPAQRFTNFHPPANGISFTARTFTADVINASATKLYLNNVDVSASLAPFPPDGTNLSFTTATSPLASNTVYNARIELTAANGLKGTNTFWFDTFSDAYLLSGTVKTIEAEEYNYTNGLFQLDPIPVSGYRTNDTTFSDPVNGGGVGYLDLVGTRGATSLESVDYFDHRTSGESPWTFEFRFFDFVGLSRGMFPEITDLNSPINPTHFSDNIRSQYVASNLVEVVVHRTEPGEWLNYTRSFTPGKYFAYLRVASYGATAVNLEKVTSDPTTTNQTTVGLGTFSIPNNVARYNYTYIPALDGLGAKAILDLSGTNTLRLTMAGTVSKDNQQMAINYILLVPADVVLLLSSSSVTGPYVADGTAIVNTATRTITVAASGSSRFYRLQATAPLTITSISVSGGTVTIKY